METKSSEVTSSRPQILASRTFICCVGQMAMLNYERSYLEFSYASVQGYMRPSVAAVAVEHLRVWILLVHGGTSPAYPSPRTYEPLELGRLFPSSDASAQKGRACWTVKQGYIWIQCRTRLKLRLDANDSRNCEESSLFFLDMYCFFIRCSIIEQMLSKQKSSQLKKNLKQF